MHPPARQAFARHAQRAPTRQLAPGRFLGRTPAVTRAQLPRATTARWVALPQRAKRVARAFFRLPAQQSACNAPVAVPTPLGRRPHRQPVDALRDSRGAAPRARRRLALRARTAWAVTLRWLPSAPLSAALPQEITAQLAPLPQQACPAHPRLRRTHRTSRAALVTHKHTLRAGRGPPQSAQHAEQTPHTSQQEPKPRS
jgi:hypothetical protein